MQFQLHIHGTTPLLQASAYQLLLPKLPTQRAVNEVAPAEQAAASTYHTSDGHFGHPSSAFRAAFLEAAKQYRIGKASAAKLLAGALTIKPADLATLADAKGNSLTEYAVDVRVIRNKSTGGRMPAGKPRWDAWHCALDIDLDERVWPVDEEGLVLFRDIIDYAGRAIGVGSGRPELRKLSFGQFEGVLTPLDGAQNETRPDRTGLNTT